MPPSSGEKRKSTFDLKNQLSDLQNKLLDTQQGKQARNRNSTSQLSEIDPSDDNSSVPRLPNVFGKRSKEGNNNKRNSLPPMPLGASGHQPGRPGNDVNFVVGLSENLLLECRRLTAENSQYKLQLKDAQDDLQRVTKQLTNVSVINKKFMEEEDSMKDKNWELEGTLQQFKEKYDKLYSENSKLSQLKIESEKTIDDLKNETELQKLANLKLVEDLSSIKQQWTTESKNFKIMNEDLNDENDKLHKSVSDLKDQVEQLKASSQKMTSVLPQLADTKFFNRDDSDSDNEFSVIDDPVSSPIKDGPSRNIELEKETIQSNLIHSNKTITKLRSTILKLKNEKEELEKKIAASNVSSKVSANYNSPINKNRKVKNLKSPPSLLSNRTSKALSFYDNSDTTNNDNWEDYSFNNSPERLMQKEDSSSEEAENVTDTNTERKLLSQELESDPVELVNKYVAENNLVLVDVNEYNSLKEIDSKYSSYELQNSAIVTAAEKYNILALPRSDGTHQLHIPVLLLKQKCAEHNLVLVDKEDYEDLLETVKYEPTEAELIERISKYNKVVLPFDEHEKLVKINDAPTLEFLQTKLTENYHQVSIDQDELEKLANPSLDRIKELASRKSCSILPVEEHKKLTELNHTPPLEFLLTKLKENYHQVSVDENEYNKLKNPSLDLLKEMASRSNRVILPQEQYEQLTDITLNPSFEFLQSKLRDTHNHVLVGQDEYDLLKNPPLDHVRKLASQLKQVVLSVEEHESLADTISHPSLKYLKSKLKEEYNYVLVTAEDYKDFNAPSFDRVKELASQKDHVLLPVSEHENLTAITTTPSLDFLQTKLHENHNHILVDESEYASLQNPSLETIKDLASRDNHIVIPRETHEQLLSVTSDPSLKYLQSKLDNHNHISIDLKELTTLKNPSLDRVKELAISQSHIVLPIEEHKKMSKIINTPSLEFLNAKLMENHNHVLVDQVEYDALNSPSLDRIKELAAQTDHVILPVHQHTTLVQKSTNPSVEEVKSFAELHDHTTLPREQYHKLQEQVTNPSSTQLYQYATAAGMVLLNKDEHSKLANNFKSPSLQFLTSKLANLNHTVVNADELNSLKTLAEETAEDKAAKKNAVVVEDDEFNTLKGLAAESAEEKALKDNAIVISKETYENLQKENADVLARIENPTIDYLKQGALSQGYVLLESSEHKSLVDSHNEPLAKKAESAGQILVEKAEHEEIMKSLENPTLEYITEKSQSQGMAIVLLAELESLKETKLFFERPTLEYLKLKATEIGHTIISDADFANLKNLESREGLELLAAVLKLSLVQTSELSDLIAFKEKYSNINALDLDELASKLNLSTIESTELLNLRQMAYNPTIDNIKSHEKNLDVAVISAEEYYQLNAVATQAVKDRETLDKAAPETISQMATKAGMVVLPISAHEELKKSANESLEEKAKRLKYIAIPLQEHEDLRREANESLEEKAKKLQHVAIPIQEYDEMNKSANQSLEDKATALQHVAIPLEEHQNILKKNADLESQFENPSEEFLKLKASDAGLLLVKKVELEDLISSSSESLELKAQRANKVLLSVEDHKELLNSLQLPELGYLIEKAKELSYGLLPIEELEELKRKLSSPTEEELEKHVKSRGSVMLDQSEHFDLSSKATAPSLDFIKEKAALHNHNLIAEDEYQSLIAAKEETLSEKAEKADSVVLPKSSYKRLSMLNETPSLEFLKEKAQLLDHDLVSNEFLKELKDLNEEPLLSKANKEGKILLSGEEYAGLQSTTEKLEKEIKSLKDKERNPTEAALVAGATALGLVVLKSADFTHLSQAAASPSLEQLLGHAAKKDHVFLAKWKYDILERKATAPSEDELTSLASTKGLSLVEPDELKRLQLEASNPSRDLLNKAAVELDLVLIPNKEYDLLKQKSTSVIAPIDTDLAATTPIQLQPPSIPSSPMSPSTKSKVLSSKHHYEEMIRQENEKKQQRQKVAASKALGIVSLSTDEYKSLIAKQQNNEPTISDIYNGAKSFGLTVLPHSDYKALLKKQNSLETRDDLELAARLLGFSIAPLNLSLNESVVSFIDEDDFEDAVSHQSSKISLSSGDIFEDALSRQLTEQNESFSHFSEALSLDDLKERAADFGFQLIPLDDAYGSDNDTTSIEDNDYEDTVHGSTVLNEPSVPVAEYEALEEQLKEKSVQLIELQNRKVTEGELVLLASGFGLIAISKEEYDSLKKELSNEDISDILASRGMVMISTDDHLKLLQESEKSKIIPTISSVSALATTFGMSVLPSFELESLRQNQTKDLTNDDLSKLALDKGLVAVSRSDYEQMGPSMKDTTLLDLASQRGFTVLTSDEYNLLKQSADIQSKAPSDDEIRSFLDNEGLITFSKEQYEELQNPSKDQIRAFLDNEGLVTLSKEKYDELQNLVTNSSANLTTDQLRELALLLGLIVLSSDEHGTLQNHKVTEMEIIEGAPDFGLAVISQSELLELQGSRAISVDELQSRAKENGMSVISTKELEILKNADISANDLAMKAAQLDLVLIPQDTYDALKTSGVSGEGLQKAAKKLGMLCIPETLYVPTTVAPTPDSLNVVILPKTYYNKLARSHTLSVERISKEDLIEHCKQRGIVVTNDQFNFENENTSLHARSHHSPQSSFHSPVLNTFKTAASTTPPTQTTPRSNIVSSPSLFSIATNVSLTDRKMIPALTQTIIGEYIYKYYRRLGPFSSISENRHERYFWIHPYSLTLYWSAVNPILGDPSTNKIRAAAILGVEVVEDNNPLPPGLYHKSIIVISSERNIRITCPTRQRHNVWYNSLRYLLERTTDGLDLSETFEHPPQSHLPSTIEEDEDEDNGDIDTYRYIKPRSSMVRPLRVVSNPTRKNSRIFSTSGMTRSNTSSSLRRKT